MISKLLHYIRDRKGIAAVEFALIAPVMLLLYIGSAETTNLLSADRKMTNSASTVADLIARAKYIDDAERDAVFESIDVIMQPFDTSGMTVVVSSVMAVEDPNSGDLRYFVGWSDTANGNASAHPECKEMSIPSGNQDLVRDGESLIVSEVTYPYEPVAPIPRSAGGIMQDVMTLEETFYLKPRRLSQIPRCDQAQNDQCPWTPPNCLN